MIIIKEMKNNPNITTKDLIELTKLSKTSIQKYIKELTEKNLIERVGSKNGGSWKVND